MPGVVVTLTRKTGRRARTQTWRVQGACATTSCGGCQADPVIPLFEGGLVRRGQGPNFAEGEGAAWCVAFTDGQRVRESYVNLIPHGGRRHA